MVVGKKTNRRSRSAVNCPARYASASVAGGCWSVVCLIEPSKAIPVNL